jgi:cytochrome c553
VIFGLTLIVALAASALVLQPRENSSDHIPSYVSWTPENTAAATSGDAFQGMLLAKRCDHCHGAEGFSAVGSIPNLAGMKKLAIWKQLEDYRARKRLSHTMDPIAESLSPRDEADVVAYYSKLPIFPDPQDNRAFPQQRPEPAHAASAARLVAFGDGERGIPPCQACHGPAGYRPGAPTLATQNGIYILNQMEAFANGTRANDINEPMRTIAELLTEDERQALADYYGSGLGLLPGSSTAPK